MKFRSVEECKYTLIQHKFFTERLQKDGLYMLNVFNTLGYTDKEIARNIGISHIWISKIKNRHRPISFELFEKILKEYEKHVKTQTRIPCRNSS